MKDAYKSVLKALSEAELLARCVFGEARGEQDVGKLAVAHVVLNRVRAGGFYGSNVRDVILKPSQFSCFNGSDPNLPVIAAPKLSKYPIDSCRVIANLALARVTLDVTGGATLYHADSIRPDWADRVRFILKIGNHLFYRE